MTVDLRVPNAFSKLTKILKTVQSFITPDGVYRQTLVLHGTRNVTQYLQSVPDVMIDDIKSNIKVWLDDCLLHTKTEDVLLANSQFLFKQISEAWIEASRQQVCVV
jgi:hypothetical protein